MKRLLASLLCFVSVVLAQETGTTQGTTTGTLDPSQVYTTGNLVQMTTTTSGSTWVNGIYQDQLTCWAWGDPGNCGPNPSVRPGNYINYSFGYTDLYQIQSIASVLPTTGLRVNGYNFGFTAKNGNGWDDARVDQLNAYVTFYGTDGSVKDYTNYDLNSKFDWTNFNYSKTFVTPYADKDLSTVQYGFTGRDNNFWAGNYGPEIMNVSFSLKYSVDPCAVNVLSSPTCPGYLEALAKLSPVVADTTETTTASSLTVSSDSPLPPPPGSLPPGSPPPPGAGPAPATNTATNTTNSSSTTTAQSNTAPLSAPAKEGAPAQTSGTALGLSVVAKNQQREQNIAAQAVQTAISTAAAAASTSQQEALSIATQAVVNSTTSAATVNTSQSNGTGLQNILGASQSSQTPGAKTENNGVNFQQNLQMLTNSTATASVAQEVKTVTAYTPTTQVSSTVIATESATTGPAVDFLTNKANPLAEYVEAKPAIATETSKPLLPGPTVNANVADNDLASGVSIARMALAPVGYADYLNLAMRDAAFYAPREVYKNQRNVDNARALRLLTNDSRHREMIEQQYRR